MVNKNHEFRLWNPPICPFIPGSPFRVPPFPVLLGDDVEGVDHHLETVEGPEGRGAPPQLLAHVVPDLCTWRVAEQLGDGG